MFLFQNLGHHEKHTSSQAPTGSTRFKIDEELLEAVSSHISFAMPSIEHKILSTSLVKAKLAELQRNYENVCRCRCHKDEKFFAKDD